MIDVLGWAATAVFVMSYFAQRAETLRRVQMVGATMWIIYGLFMHAPPVVASNVLVVVAAAWTAARASSGSVESASHLSGASDSGRPV